MAWRSAWSVIMLFLMTVPTATISFAVFSSSSQFCSRVATPFRCLVTRGWCSTSLFKSIRRAACAIFHLQPPRVSMSAAAREREADLLQAVLEQSLASPDFHQLVDHLGAPLGPQLALSPAESTYWNDSNCGDEEDFSWVHGLRHGLPRRPYTALLAAKLLDVADASAWPR